ncbi:substrate-binding domain-containing protein [Christensenella intestinihominis]|uniref:substrate-binding domain-containing protein n=1 Tax=Christensenella intestinihominis TaxID=1851429 RepID=UPI00082B8E28|nr:substrate-binding domain-containing protein [Christensenella intestinihominis]
MKKSMKSILTLALVAVMCVGLFAACSQPQTTGDEPAETESAAGTPAAEEPSASGSADNTGAGNDITAKIGITFQDLSNEFVANEKKALTAYVAENYPNIELLILDGAGDASNQVGQMENFINQGVDAIICNPQESTALQPSYEAAIAAGIPVVSVGTDINEKVGQVWSSCPDIPGAEKQVEYMTSLFDDDKVIDVAIMRGVIGHQAEILRSEGYDNVINQNPDKYNIVFDQSANYSREEGLALMENWLSSGKNIDAVIAQNDEMALGAAEAVKSAGLQDQIKIFGIDGIEDAVNGVKDGTLSATLYQDGTQIITNAFDLALKSIQGEAVSDIAIDQQLCTKDNVQEFLDKIKYLADLPS